MKAFLKNYRQSPRKTRLIADLVRGKQVRDALVLLSHTDKRATRAFHKLIASAVANARHNDKAKADELFIQEIRVNEGVTLHRYQPVARGSAHPIRKRTSNISLELGQVQEKKSKVQSSNVKKTKKKEAVAQS